jgi:hypothetical protein
MDGARFDALIRSLTVVQSRRGLARLLGSLGFVGLACHHDSEDVLAGGLAGGFACLKDRQCQTHLCLSNGTCACSRDFPTCKQPGNACKRAKCNVATGKCKSKNKTAQTPCPDDGDPCTNDVCDGKGACKHRRKPEGSPCGEERTCHGPGVCCVVNGDTILAGDPTSACCSQRSDPQSSARNCVGRESGDPCAFGAQCESGECVQATCN